MLSMLHFKLLHLKSLKFCEIISLTSFPVNFQVLNTPSKDKKWTIIKLQTVCLYHKYSKSYKLLNTMTLKKCHSFIQHEIQLENLQTPNMNILLIGKSEKPCLTSFLV